MKDLLEKFKSTGLRLTPQRLAILQFLEENMGVHPSAEDVYTAVKKDNPSISLATVYNTLDALTKKGAVVEITVASKKRHYESNTKPHHHIVCTQCGKIADVWEDDMDTEPLMKGDFGGFKVMDCHVNFTGICQECEEEVKA